MDRFSVCIVGAGVIGLAIAEQLSKSKSIDPEKIVLLEQESAFGQHISSRHSEVIHAGIYYPSNSLKAKFCVRGRELLYEHCESFNVPFKKIGKCIVASEEEMASLEALQQAAANNGVNDLQYWEGSKLRSEEPAVSAMHALYSPSTGIIDSHSYMQSLYQLATSRGVLFAPYTKVNAIDYDGSGFQLDTTITGKTKEETYSFRSEVLVNCAGLSAQALAEKIPGIDPSIIPALHLCKGDYFTYSKKNPFNHLIYPLPEKNTTGLGIHSTQDLSGQLRFGPDTEYVQEVNYDIDVSKKERFANAIRSYFPTVSAEHLQPAYSGIRPKLSAQGETASDFVIQTSAQHRIDNLIQLFGIESPGLTSSLAIAEHITMELWQAI